MTRDEVREALALKAITDRARANGTSTLQHTIHATADTIDAIVAAGGAQFKDYDAKTRRRMASEGRAMPDGSFPIADCSDAEDAIRSQGRAKPGKRDAVRSHISKRVKALRCSGRIYEPYR